MIARARARAYSGQTQERPLIPVLCVRVYEAKYATSSVESPRRESRVRKIYRNSYAFANNYSNPSIYIERFRDKVLSRLQFDIIASYRYTNETRGSIDEYRPLYRSTNRRTYVSEALARYSRNNRSDPIRSYLARNIPSNVLLEK